MNYNPYTKEYYALKEKLSNIKVEKEELLKKLDWFNNIDISNLHFLLKGKEDDKNSIEQIITKINNRIDELTASINNYKNNIKTNLNPFNWFNNDQKSLKSMVKQLDKD